MESSSSSRSVPTSPSASSSSGWVARIKAMLYPLDDINKGEVTTEQPNPSLSQSSSSSSTSSSSLSHILHAIFKDFAQPAPFISSLGKVVNLIEPFVINIAEAGSTGHVVYHILGDATLFHLLPYTLKIGILDTLYFYFKRSPYDIIRSMLGFVERGVDASVEEEKEEFASTFSSSSSSFSLLPSTSPSSLAHNFLFSMLVDLLMSTKDKDKASTSSELHLSVGKRIILLIGLVGTSGISGNLLKKFLLLLRGPSEYSNALLQTLNIMMDVDAKIMKALPPYFYNFGGAGAGIISNACKLNLPREYQIITWFRAEVLESSSLPPPQPTAASSSRSSIARKQKLHQTLASLKSGLGDELEIFIEEGRLGFNLKVGAGGDMTTHIISSKDVSLSRGTWYHLQIKHTKPRLSLFGRDEISIHIDHKLVYKDMLTYPNFSSDNASITLGSNFNGQMTAFYILSEALPSNSVERVAEFDAGHSFPDKTGSGSTSAVMPDLVRDSNNMSISGSDKKVLGMGDKVVACLHPNRCHQGIAVDIHGGCHGELQSKTFVWKTSDFLDAMGSLGGVSVFLPLFPRLLVGVESESSRQQQQQQQQQQQEGVGRERRESRSASNVGGSLSSGPVVLNSPLGSSLYNFTDDLYDNERYIIDEEVLSSLVREREDKAFLPCEGCIGHLFSILAKVMGSSEGAQRSLLALCGVEMIEYVLRCVSPDILHSESEACIQALMQLRKAVKDNRKLDVSITQRLLCNFEIWSRSSYSLQCALMSILLASIKAQPDYFKEVIGVQGFLDALNTCYLDASGGSSGAGQGGGSGSGGGGGGMASHDESASNDASPHSPSRSKRSVISDIVNVINNSNSSNSNLLDHSSSGDNNVKTVDSNPNPGSSVTATAGTSDSQFDNSYDDNENFSISTPSFGGQESSSDSSPGGGGPLSSNSNGGGGASSSSTVTPKRRTSRVINLNSKFMSSFKMTLNREISRKDIDDVDRNDNNKDDVSGGLLSQSQNSNSNSSNTDQTGHFSPQDHSSCVSDKTITFLAVNTDRDAAASSSMGVSSPRTTASSEQNQDREDSRTSINSSSSNSNIVVHSHDSNTTSGNTTSNTTSTTTTVLTSTSASAFSEKTQSPDVQSSDNASYDNANANATSTTADTGSTNDVDVDVDVDVGGINGFDENVSQMSSFFCDYSNTREQRRYLRECLETIVVSVTLYAASEREISSIVDFICNCKDRDTLSELSQILLCLLIDGGQKVITSVTNAFGGVEEFTSFVLYSLVYHPFEPIRCTGIRLLTHYYIQLNDASSSSLKRASGSVLDTLVQDINNIVTGGRKGMQRLELSGGLSLLQEVLSAHKGTSSDSTYAAMLEMLLYEPGMRRYGNLPIGESLDFIGSSSHMFSQQARGNGGDSRGGGGAIGARGGQQQGKLNNMISAQVPRKFGVVQNEFASFYLSSQEDEDESMINPIPLSFYLSILPQFQISYFQQILTDLLSLVKQSRGNCSSITANPRWHLCLFRMATKLMEHCNSNSNSISSVDGIEESTTTSGSTNSTSSSNNNSSSGSGSGGGCGEIRSLSSTIMAELGQLHYSTSDVISRIFGRSLAATTEAAAGIKDGFDDAEYLHSQCQFLLRYVNRSNSINMSNNSSSNSNSNSSNSGGSLPSNSESNSYSQKQVKLSASSGAADVDSAPSLDLVFTVGVKAYSTLLIHTLDTKDGWRDVLESMALADEVDVGHSVIATVLSHVINEIAFTTKSKYRHFKKIEENTSNKSEMSETLEKLVNVVSFVMATSQFILLDVSTVVNGIDDRDLLKWRLECFQEVLQSPTFQSISNSNPNAATRERFGSIDIAASLGMGGNRDQSLSKSGVSSKSIDSSSSSSSSPSPDSSDLRKSYVDDLPHERGRSRTLSVSTANSNSSISFLHEGDTNRPRGQSVSPSNLSTTDYHQIHALSEEKLISFIGTEAILSGALDEGNTKAQGVYKLSDQVSFWYNWQDVTSKTEVDSSSSGSAGSAGGDKSNLDPLERDHCRTTRTLTLVLQLLRCFDSICWPHAEGQEWLLLNQKGRLATDTPIRNKNFLKYVPANSSIKLSMFSSSIRMCLYVLQTMAPTSDLALLNVQRLKAMVQVAEKVPEKTTPVQDWLVAIFVHVTLALQRVHLILFPFFFESIGIKENLTIPKLGLREDVMDASEGARVKADAEKFETFLQSEKNVDEIVRIFRANGGRQLLSYIDACISILQLMFDEYFELLRKVLGPKVLHALKSLVERVKNNALDLWHRERQSSSSTSPGNYGSSSPPPSNSSLKAQFDSFSIRVGGTDDSMNANPLAVSELLKAVLEGNSGSSGGGVSADNDCNGLGNGADGGDEKLQSRDDSSSSVSSLSSNHSRNSLDNLHIETKAYVYDPNSNFAKNVINSFTCLRESFFRFHLLKEVFVLKSLSALEKLECDCNNGLRSHLETQKSDLLKKCEQDDGVKVIEEIMELKDMWNTVTSTIVGRDSERKSLSRHIDVSRLKRAAAKWHDCLHVFEADWSPWFNEDYLDPQSGRAYTAISHYMDRKLQRNIMLPISEPIDHSDAAYFEGKLKDQLVFEAMMRGEKQEDSAAAAGSGGGSLSSRGDALISPAPSFLKPNVIKEMVRDRSISKIGGGGNGNNDDSDNDDMDESATPLSGRDKRNFDHPPPEQEANGMESTLSQMTGLTFSKVDRPSWTWLFEWDADEKILYKPFKVKYIALEQVVNGELLLSNKHIYIHPERQATELTKPMPDTRWSLNRLTEVYARRYLLQNSAIEIFFSDSPEIFLAFRTQNELSKFYRVLRKLCVNTYHALPATLTARSIYEQQSDLTDMWQRREISNFEYIMRLNIIAGRSFNDITQYPVFPWVIADYTSETIDLGAKETYRDFKKPVGAFNSARLKEFLDRYRTFDMSDEGIPKFMYGSHYSSAGVVMHYMIRQEPFTSMAINLQGGRFDCPDRLFFDINRTWQGCNTSMSDVKELIPEFFCFPEIFINTNKLPLGELQEGGVVDHVLLPKWAKDPYDFIRINREALESDFASERIHDWIDLIFGYKQTGQAAIDSHNVFYYLTYENSVDIEAIQDPLQREAAKAQVTHFGQTPSQLFTKEHPRRLSRKECLVPIISDVENASAKKLEFSTPLQQFGHSAGHQSLSSSSKDKDKEGKESAIISIRCLGDKVFCVHSNLAVTQYKWSSHPEGKSNFKIEPKIKKQVPQFSSCSFEIMKIGEYFKRNGGGGASSQDGQNRSSSSSSAGGSGGNSGGGGVFSFAKRMMGINSSSSSSLPSSSSSSHTTSGPSVSTSTAASDVASTSSTPTRKSSTNSVDIIMRDSLSFQSTVYKGQTTFVPFDSLASQHVCLVLDDANVYGRVVSIGYWDNSLKVHSLDSMREVASISMGHSIQLCCVSSGAINQSNRLIITGDACGVVSLYLLEDPILACSIASPHIAKPSPDSPGYVLHCVANLVGHPGAIVSISHSYCRDLVVSSSVSGMVVLHSIKDGRYLRCIRSLMGRDVRKILITNTGYIVTYSVGISSGDNNQEKSATTPPSSSSSTSADGQLDLFWTDGHHLATLKVSSRIECVTINGDSNVLVCGHVDGSISLRYLHSLEWIVSFAQTYNRGAVTSLAFSDDAQFLFVGYADGTFAVATDPESRWQVISSSIQRSPLLNTV